MAGVSVTRSAKGNQAEAGEELHEAIALCHSGSYQAGLDLAVRSLEHTRATICREEWWNYCAAVRRLPSLMDVALQSALTRRALEKPRGYAGDAVLMDLFYGLDGNHLSLSECGTAVYAWEFNLGGARSVRHRRTIVSEQIRELRLNQMDARIMSVACGHLRELVEYSSQADASPFSSFVALDHDAHSLSEVKRAYGSLGVRAVQASVQQMVRTPPDLGAFDFIYASGVYDYLQDRMARMLTETLFRMLAKGGTLLIGNFCPDMLGIGYMEAVMDWRLVFRSETDMTLLMRRLGGSSVATMRTFREPEGNIVFLEIQRK